MAPKPNDYGPELVARAGGVAAAEAHLRAEGLDPDAIRAAFASSVCIRGRCSTCGRTVNLADHRHVAPESETERRAAWGDR